ncbi:hypothetical protein THF5H11_160030 [Vibrio jasicida]|nr:hypothetical protein THF5H11_160030 [Vibrio jasicida]
MFLRRRNHNTTPKIIDELDVNNIALFLSFDQLQSGKVFKKRT